MAVEDVRGVLGRTGPGPQDPLDASILAGIAAPPEMREIRDEVLDLEEALTLQGAEDEDVRGELLNEADVTALGDAAARLAAERPDLDGEDGGPVRELGRYCATYAALGQLERAAGSLQLDAHTAVLLLSADLTRKNEKVRGRITTALASTDLTGRRVLEALFGEESPVSTGAADASADRRARVRLLDAQGAEQVGAALREAELLRRQLRGAALREVPLPPLRAPALPAAPRKNKRRKP